MTQVFVAAWVGITVGWMGFGWVLAEAPAEQVAMGHSEPMMEQTGAMTAGVDILQDEQVVVRKEPNLRG